MQSQGEPLGEPDGEPDGELDAEPRCNGGGVAGGGEVPSSPLGHGYCLYPSYWPEVATANDATHDLGIALVTSHHVICFGYVTQIVDLAGAHTCTLYVLNLYNLCATHNVPPLL